MFYGNQALLSLIILTLLTFSQCGFSFILLLDFSFPLTFEAQFFIHFSWEIAGADNPGAKVYRVPGAVLPLRASSQGNPPGGWACRPCKRPPFKLQGSFLFIMLVKQIV